MIRVVAVEVVRRAVAAASKPDRVGRLRRRIAATYPLDFNRTFDSLLFVAGTGRSGTTWLVDLLDADRSHRVIFEPFTPQYGALGERRIPRYVRPSTRDDELTEVVGRILLARFKSTQWTARGNDRLVSRRRIIKDVQSNLRLGWMRENFPHFPIVLIIRHPCAVAASRQRLKDVRSVERILEDPLLVEDHLAPYMESLRGLESPFDNEIARWCIETRVPLDQMMNGLDIEVVLYERLVADPFPILERLWRRLGQTPPPELQERLHVPSLTAYRPDDPLPSPEKAVDDWVDRLSADQTSRALELLAAFDLDWLYGESPHPRVEDVRQGLDGLDGVR